MSSTVKKQQRRRQAMPRPPSVPRVAVKAPPLQDAEGMATLANKLTAEAAASPALFVSPPYLAPLQAAAAALGSAITAAQGGTDAAQPPQAAQPAPATADPEVFYPSPRVSVFADLTFVSQLPASVCPGENWFRLLIGAHMGHDSFEPNLRGVYVGRVRVAMSRIPGGFASTYTWVDAQGVTRPVPHYRQLGATWFHCREAMEDLVVDLIVYFRSIEVDLGEKHARKAPPPPYCPATLAAPVPVPEAPSTSAVAPCPPATRFDLWPEFPLAPLRAPEPDPPKPLDRWPIAIRIGLGVGPELIASGWGSFRFSGELGARYRWASIGTEVHGDPSLGTLTYPEGSVRFARISGALLLCAHFGWFVGCGVSDTGKLLFPNHVQALPASAFYGAAGGRAGLEFPLIAPRLFLRTALDLLAPIRPASYTAAHSTLFQVAGPGVVLGFNLVLELSP
jgi:hypothetical protein